MSDSESATVYRILDANINRLREALRVIEEFVRFKSGDADLSARIKRIRHACKEIVEGLDKQMLLDCRDIQSDPFAFDMQPEERDRNGLAGVITANVIRAQEAGRVIEEYAKAIGAMKSSENAKRLRFEMYDVEKLIGVPGTNG